MRSRQDELGTGCGCAGAPCERVLQGWTYKERSRGPGGRARACRRLVRPPLSSSSRSPTAPPLPAAARPLSSRGTRSTAQLHRSQSTEACAQPLARPPSAPLPSQPTSRFPWRRPAPHGHGAAARAARRSPMPTVTRSAAAKDAVKQAGARLDDGTVPGTRRAVFAERRAAAGQPAVVDTLSTVTAVASAPATTSPLSAVRRRSIASTAAPANVDTAPLRSPRGISAALDPSPTMLESAAYLQQARISIASSHGGSTSSHERRPSSFAGASAPRPSLSHTVQSLLTSPFRSPRSSSRSCDRLLASQPSDLRRPSYLSLALGAPDPGTKSPNPNGVRSSATADALELVSLHPGGGRRAQRHLRALVLLGLAFLALLTVMGRLSLPAAPVVARATEPARDELVLGREELAAMRARRARDLWGPPEDEVHVEAEGPAKGHEHESTIIFLHVRPCFSLLSARSSRRARARARCRSRC